MNVPWSRRTLLVAAASALVAFGAAEARAQGLASEAEKELPRIAQELVDALAPGDRAVWDRYLDDSCVLTDENGDVTPKARLLEQLRPLPAGYVGRIAVTDAAVRTYGDTAVLTHLDVEDLTIFGQTLRTSFRSTDTYVRREGRWRMVASQVMVIPSPRKSVAVDAKLLDAYVGTYELAPGVTYAVSREGGTLIGQRSGRPKEELVAAGEATFFRKGSVRGEKIFVRDPDGHVRSMLDRRDNNDLVWKRVATAAAAP